MARVFLMQTGRTTFEEQSRIESVAGAPLTPQGVAEVQEQARRLADSEIDAVYTSQGEAERQSARLAADILGLKVHTTSNLREIDYGLWQGLTLAELKRRQPKVYRQWTDEPMSVCPPGGETMREAGDRVRAAVKSIVKRHRDETLLVVLRPVAMGLLRCALEGRQPATIWQQVDCEFICRGYETDGKNL